MRKMRFVSGESECVKTSVDTTSLQEQWRLFTGDPKAQLLWTVGSEKLSPANETQWKSFSLQSHSHSKSHRLSVMAEGPRLRAVGVDLESQLRPVDLDLQQWLLSPEERNLLGPIDFLIAWVIKEALFKADPENQNQTIQNYRIESYLPHRKQGAARTPSGKAQRFFWQVLQEPPSNESWFVGLAVSED